MRVDSYIIVYCKINILFVADMKLSKRHPLEVIFRSLDRLCEGNADDIVLLSKEKGDGSIYSKKIQPFWFRLVCTSLSISFIE